MEVYFKLGLLALIPVVLSQIFYTLQKRTSFGKAKYWIQQAIIGVFFGLAAVCGTEFGVDIQVATINTRDAAPMCAGLIFGGPAGIIAGLIGGIERWFAASWGRGTYTQLACSVSTILSGLMAAGLRKHLFDDKRPTWGIGFFVGVIIEVVHMILVFVTHLNDAQNAFRVVMNCAAPMIIVNSVATGLALLCITLLYNKSENKGKKSKNIAYQIQRALLAVVVFAFAVTTLFLFRLQTNINTSDMEEEMTTTLDDVVEEVRETSNANIIEKARMCAQELDRAPSADLHDMALRFDIAEVNIVSNKGKIIRSNNPILTGFDMTSGEQSDFFMDIVRFDYTSRVQAFGPTTYVDNNGEAMYRKYAAYQLGRGGFVQVGYDADQFKRTLAGEVASLAKHRHVGQSGYIVIADQDEKLVSKPLGLTGETIADLGIDVDDSYEAGKTYEQNVLGEKAYCKYVYEEGYYIIAVINEKDAYLYRDIEVYVNSFLEVLVFGLLFGTIYFLVKIIVVDNIRKINSSLGRIIDGDLGVVVDVHSSDEFSSLSDDINSTVTTLKRYISEAAARIDKELAYAKNIQQAALPNVTPALMAIPNFDVKAFMNTAKEVGGDFYDFYLLDKDKLAFMIADVSGKGIPAAMFMMTAKTMIKNMAENNISVEEVLTRANDHLCENNEAGMFVTVWMGILDYKTGHVTYANAGHNPPLVYRAESGEFEYLRTRPGLVLAGMEGIKYKLWEFDLNAGDRIYLYTDGVTEATDKNNVLYGEERLLAYVNEHTADPQEEFLKGVQSDIDAFIDGAPQFDDITMVIVDYKGDVV